MKTFAPIIVFMKKLLLLVLISFSCLIVLLSCSTTERPKEEIKVEEVKLDANKTVIKLIRNPEENSDSLYYDYKLPDEEEVPDFLQGEELQEFSSDDMESVSSCENMEEMTAEEVVDALTETEESANEEEIG